MKINDSIVSNIFDSIFSGSKIGTNLSEFISRGGDCDSPMFRKKFVSNINQKLHLDPITASVLLTNLGLSFYVSKLIEAGNSGRRASTNTLIEYLIDLDYVLKPYEMDEVYDNSVLRSCYDAYAEVYNCYLIYKICRQFVLRDTTGETINNWLLEEKRNGRLVGFSKYMFSYHLKRYDGLIDMLPAGSHLGLGHSFVREKYIEETL